MQSLRRFIHNGSLVDMELKLGRASSTSSWTFAVQILCTLLDSFVYISSNCTHMLFPVQVTLDNIVCLNKVVQFLLQLPILHRNNVSMLIQRLQLLVQVPISV